MFASSQLQQEWQLDIIYGLQPKCKCFMSIQIVFFPSLYLDLLMALALNPITNDSIKQLSSVTLGKWKVIYLLVKICVMTLGGILMHKNTCI